MTRHARAQIPGIRGFAPLIGVALLAMAGCGGTPAKTLLVTPPSLDFGTTKLNETVRVASPLAGTKLSIRLECDAPWLTVAPARLFSDGPNDATTVVLSVSRTSMKPGRNTCRVKAQAPGFADTMVFVSAQAIVSADFRVSLTSARPGELIVFNDATRVLTGAKPVTAWNWDFGDGTTSTEQNPVHAFTDPGIYSVSLSVTSENGTDVRVRMNCVTVKRPALPDADFVAATRRPVQGAPVQFRDISVPGASGISSWLWWFGDGTASTEQDPLHLYSVAAVYDVYLTVSNANGSDTELKLGYIDVQPAKK